MSMTFALAGGRPRRKRTKMPEYLLDTGVLIRHLRGRKEMKEHFTWLVSQGRVWMSVLSRAELLRGMRDHERQRTGVLLNTVPSLSVDAATADLAGDLMREYLQQGTTLDLADTIIAATAIRHELILATYNLRDFPMPELRLAKLPE